MSSEPPPDELSDTTASGSDPFSPRDSRPGSADTAEEPDFPPAAVIPDLPESSAGNKTPSHSPSTMPPTLPPEPLSSLHRSFLAVFGIFLLAGFLLAISLTPNPQGFGTHRSLGLPPCSMKAIFNTPCPACGMTTSFAHFVRGQLPSSLRANAAGTALAAVCLLLMPWSLWSAWRGSYVGLRDPATALAWGLSSLAAFTLLHWVWRLWIDGYI